jgi:hypothetical protein
MFKITLRYFVERFDLKRTKTKYIYNSPRLQLSEIKKKKKKVPVLIYQGIAFTGREDNSVKP